MEMLGRNYHFCKYRLGVRELRAPFCNESWGIESSAGIPWVDNTCPVLRMLESQQDPGSPDSQSELLSTAVCVEEPTSFFLDTLPATVELAVHSQHTQDCHKCAGCRSMAWFLDPIGDGQGRGLTITNVPSLPSQVPALTKTSVVRSHFIWTIWYIAQKHNYFPNSSHSVSPVLYFQRQGLYARREHVEDTMAIQ